VFFAGKCTLHANNEEKSVCTLSAPYQIEQTVRKTVAVRSAERARLAHPITRDKAHEHYKRTTHIIEKPLQETTPLQQRKPYERKSTCQ